MDRTNTRRVRNRNYSCTTEDRGRVISYTSYADRSARANSENDRRPRNGNGSGSRNQAGFSHNDRSQQGRSNRSRMNQANDTHGQKSQRKPYSRNHMGFGYLQSLLQKPLEETMSKIIENKDFFEFIGNPLPPDFVVLIVKLVSNFCQCEFSSLRNRILQKCLSTNFINNIVLYISSLPVQNKADKQKNSCFWKEPDTFWNEFLKVCKTASKEMPQSFCNPLSMLLKIADLNIPQIESAHSIHICDETKNELKSLIQMQEAIASEMEKKESKPSVVEKDEGEPPNDFREIPVYPTSIELISQQKPFLRKNVIEGPYKDVNHYLDIQFRLLREDFVGPLRDGITAYLSNTSSRIQNVKIHKKVRFLQPITATEHYCVLLEFGSEKKKKSFNYENSRRFMYGSLVCFTRNNFKTILFGKIVDRDEKYLKNGQIVIGFDANTPLEYNKDYTMVECSVYFEPYYQVLSVMKEIAEEDFPMKDYIINVSTTSALPNYISDKTVFYTPRPYKLVDLQPDLAFGVAFDSFNNSQNIAFKAALTRQFSIIQGPPGTGKTYVGLKIARTLLNNASAWYQRSPMLVICYTNHALDQFLEGLLDTTEDIIRIGGQSKNEKLKAFNLRNHTRMGEATYGAKLRVKNCLSEVKTITETLSMIRNYDCIIDFEAFEEVIPNFGASWLASATRDDVIKWLLGTYNEPETGEPDVLIEKFVSFNLGEDDRGEQEEANEMNEESLGLEEEFDIKVHDQAPLLRLVDLYKKISFNNAALRQMEELLDGENYDVFFRYRNLDVLNRQLMAQYYFMKEKLDRGKNGAFIRLDIDIRNSKYISLNDRWHLYFYWLRLYERFLLQRHEAVNKQFRQAYKLYNDTKELESVRILKDMKVIGLTTTGAARLHSSLQMMKSPIVIVEEAAEVLEAHIITSLTKHCQQLILIGDHQQLRPSTSNYQLEKHYYLGISMFERMILNKVQCFTLNIQHRMRPEISSLITPSVYPNLKDHESVLDRPIIRGIDKCLYFIDHTNPEMSDAEDTSKKNLHEVEFLILLAKYLIFNGYKPEEITILAAYLGQMFELQKEKAKYQEHLKDVRIAVLDNYQGEECDIILLSLVRNNSIGKIGFLSIENRVCVALSRAKNGLYVMGNMSLLCDHSELWCKINETLVQQNSVGRALALKCQIHQKLTEVCKPDDFLAVAEGGCDIICGMLLPCQHSCPRLCHVIDREHKTNKCQENCTKLLCDNDPLHVCKKKCYEDCGACDYLVFRNLPCNHDANMLCSMDVMKYRCMITDTVTLQCGHQADKPCHEDIKYFKCPFKCDTRLDCGHSCLKSCHIRNDPDHLEYKCPKPCERPPRGCTNPDKKGHTCPKLCWDECAPCEILVKKVRTVCPHAFDVPCCENVDEITCSKPCKKELPCGHKCKNVCSIPCGLCTAEVQKEIPGCKHKAKLPCHVVPDKSYCRGKCSREMSCGHICKRRCMDECDPLKCEEIVEVYILAKCGHVVKRMPCNTYSKYKTDGLLDNLESFCTEPCKEKLNCNSEGTHLCRGSCGECFQGRVHKRCGEKCGLLLVCNHLCEIPCRESCQPCQKPCTYKCKHSICKKRCGEPCAKCREKCNRQCRHQKCKNKCGEICSVPPCIAPCDKKLEKCGHPCLGFCGDPCPPVCRICSDDTENSEVCDEQKIEIFFGTEDEENSRFVLLNDCKHSLESSGMEQWLAQDENEIKFKVCPRCKTTICTTERYSDYIKRAISDICKVKEKLYGRKNEITSKRVELHENLRGLSFDKDYFNEITRSFMSSVGILMKRLPVKGANGRLQHINSAELDSIQIKYNLLDSVYKIVKNALSIYSKEFFSKQFSSSATKGIQTQLEFIFEIMLRKLEDITKTEIEDIQREISRLNQMFNLALIVRSSETYIRSNPDTLAKIQTVTGMIYSLSKYENNIDKTVKLHLEELKVKLKSAILITDSEKKEIIKAIGLTKGHWFKCPNGHPYAIGECGGAMVTSKCYECGAPIGGRNHTLLSTNNLASDFDGATHPAWSNMQNLANYDL